MNTRPSFCMAAIILLSGCGAYNNGPSAFNLKVVKGTSVTAVEPSNASSPGPGGAGYDCSTSAVITTDAGPADDSGKYKVCTSRKSLTDIQIQGRPMRGNQLCVFPIRVVGSDPAQAQYDNSGNPISSCVTVSTATVSPLASLSFPGVNFNALAILDLNDEFGRNQKETMDQCLRSRLYSSCPVYSYGIFR